MQKRIVLLTMIALAVVSLLTSCRGLSAEQKNAANDALKPLQKLKAAAEIGVNKMQYGSLVIDAQSAVNQALPKLPDGDLRKEIKSAMEAYADANALWGENKTDTILFVGRPLPTGDEFKDKIIGAMFSETATTMQERYKIPVHEDKYIQKDEGLSIIWKAAKEHVDRASKLLEQ